MFLLCHSKKINKLKSIFEKKGCNFFLFRVTFPWQDTIGTIEDLQFCRFSKKAADAVLFTVWSENLSCETIEWDLVVNHLQGFEFLILNLMFVPFLCSYINNEWNCNLLILFLFLPRKDSLFPYMILSLKFLKGILKSIVCNLVLFIISLF